MKKAAEAEAARCALAGDLAGERAARHRIKAIAMRALAAQRAHSLRPQHPVHVRQDALWTNECRLKDRSYLQLGLMNVQPHPTRRKERMFARELAAAK